jgi:hypothetical protein
MGLEGAGPRVPTSQLTPRGDGGIATPLEQQLQEKVADEAKQVEDGSCRSGQAETGEKLPQQEAAEEASSNKQLSECNGY